MKKLPYGISDFRRLVKENCYYVDKTRYIHDMEEFASYLFLIRPRRFGKSLFINMLCTYYDILEKDNFSEYFGNLWIGTHPTPNANRYQIIRFDFSQAGDRSERLEEAFNKYCCGVLDEFISKYAKYYDECFIANVLKSDSAAHKLNMIGERARWKEYPLYLIIDEYDNFTNVVLAEEGKEKFHALTHADGFYRQYFKIFKAIFDRVFLIGVSPVTLDDVTSGYNIDWNITLEPRFNDVLGFTEKDVLEMLEYYKRENAFGKEADIDSMMEEMRPWYDNYCFSGEGLDRPSLYNCDMVLYYINAWMRNGCAPKEMADKNIRTDYSKLKMLIDIDCGRGEEHRLDIIKEIANNGFYYAPIVSSFPAMEITNLDNFVSLIYYHGMLTIGGVRGSRFRLIIPNQCVREQYWSYLFEYYSKGSDVRINVLRDDFDKMAFEGEWRPAIELISRSYAEVSSIRDTIGGEHNVQGFFKAFLSVCDYHVLCPEIETGYGYSDFLMLADTRRFPEVRHSYIMELKYAKGNVSDSVVEELVTQGSEQVERYASDLKVQRLAAGGMLHGLVVVIRGHELAVATQTFEKLLY